MPSETMSPPCSGSRTLRQRVENLLLGDGGHLHFLAGGGRRLLSGAFGRRFRRLDNTMPVAQPLSGERSGAGLCQPYACGRRPLKGVGAR